MSPLSDRSGRSASPPPRKQGRPYRKLDPHTVKLIAEKRMQLDMSNRAIARDLNLSEPTVRWALRRFDRHGDEDRHSGGSRPQVSHKDVVEFVIKFMEVEPELQLAEVTKKIEDRFGGGRTPQESTLCRLLCQEIHVRLKRVVPEKFIVNDDDVRLERMDFAKRYLRENLQSAVYLGETGFNAWNYPRKAKNFEGFRGVPNSKSSNMSCCLAVSCEEGIVHCKSIIGGDNGVNFTEFLKEILARPIMDAAQHGHRMIILDNAKLHNTEEMDNIIKSAGHRRVFQPRYSPPFNLCEYVFGFIKNIVRRRRSEEGLRLLDDHFYMDQHAIRGFYHDCLIPWMRVAERGHPVRMSYNAAAELARIQRQEIVINIDHQAPPSSYSPPSMRHHGAQPRRDAAELRDVRRADQKERAERFRDVYLPVHPDDRRPAHGPLVEGRVDDFPPTYNTDILGRDVSGQRGRGRGSRGGRGTTRQSERVGPVETQYLPVPTQEELLRAHEQQVMEAIERDDAYFTREQRRWMQNNEEPWIGPTQFVPQEYHSPAHQY